MPLPWHFNSAAISFWFILDLFALFLCFRFMLDISTFPYFPLYQFHSRLNHSLNKSFQCKHIITEFCIFIHLLGPFPRPQLDRCCLVVLNVLFQDVTKLHDCMKSACSPDLPNLPSPLVIISLWHGIVSSLHQKVITMASKDDLSTLVPLFDEFCRWTCFINTNILAGTYIVMTSRTCCALTVSLNHLWSKHSLTQKFTWKSILKNT